MPSASDRSSAIPICSSTYGLPGSTPIVSGHPRPGPALETAVSEVKAALDATPVGFPLNRQLLTRVLTV